jgi:hypothetical protein
MKKRFLAAAVAATITLTAGVAMASPLQFDGDLTFQYRWNDYDVKAKDEGGIATFRLNATAALNQNVDFYARLAGQALTADEVGADFNTNHNGSSVFSFDRFGFNVHSNNTSYKIGRQGLNIGATALLYSTEGKVDNYSGTIDGVSAKVKSGVTDLSFVAGATNWDTATEADANIYAFHAGFNPSSNLTLGATYAKYDSDIAAETTNHWAVDASYQLGKANLFGEYSQSDADDQNKAFVVGTSYAFDAKNSFAAMYSKVEAAGDMNQMTDFDPNGKGMYYSYNHKFTKDTSLNIFYKDMEDVSGTNAGKGNTSFRTTVSYKF